MSQRRGGNASTNNNTNNRAYHQSSMMMISEEENIIMDFDDANNNNNEEEESAAGRVLAMMNAPPSSPSTATTTSSSSSSSSSSLFITSRKKTRGYLAVFLVSAIWVCASFIVKDLERVGDPLTLTALFNALFLVYWPVEMKGVFLESSREKGKRYYAGMFRKWKEAFDATTGTTSTTSTSTSTTNNRRRSMAMKLGGANEALRCYVIVPPLFFLAQFFFNKSLQFVSVTVNTALSSVAPALTYVLGIYRGLEKPVRDSNGFLKALGLVALGVVLTAVADDETAFGSGSGFANDGENSQRTRGDDNNYDSYDSSSSANSFVNLDTAWGVALILASAVCYAGYATEVEIALNSVKVSDGNRYENSSNNRNSNPFFSRSSGTGGVLLERDEEEQTEEEEAEREAKKELLAAIKDSKSRQILASVGTFAFVIVLCTMRKSISSMSESGGMIILKGLIDNALAEYLWCVGVAELGASVASIGLLLQIPLSAVAELLFARADEEVWTRTSRGIFAMFCGCALIVYGFIGAMKFAGSSEEEEEEDGEDEELDDSNVARAPLL
jgi:drug/metabolite transporter (DMT)-like permease